MKIIITEASDRIGESVDNNTHYYTSDKKSNGQRMDTSSSPVQPC